MTLFRQLLGCFAPGDVVMGDPHLRVRTPCSAQLLAPRSSAIFRLHQKRKGGFPQDLRLGRNDIRRINGHATAR
ncbi:MAG: hypothetical protein H6816_07235 [Phycisphaerales bacterium]|nr:hypothetical protein [Phycisphaerales bacterium]